MTGIRIPTIIFAVPFTAWNLERKKAKVMLKAMTESAVTPQHI